MKARLPQGYGGGKNDMLQRVQKMQEDMETLREELDAKEYTASSGGGMVTAVVTGAHQLTSLKINPDVVDADDVEMLEDLIIAAVNEATNTAEADSAAKMENVTGGMSIPGLM